MGMKPWRMLCTRFFQPRGFRDDQQPDASRRKAMDAKYVIQAS
jgi:hypothetical protein